MSRHTVHGQLFAHRRFRQLVALLISCAVLIGVLIVPVERSEGNIQTFGDGLWWAFVTASGVGYGDLVPVTPLGRVLGVLLMATGVSLTGLLIGMIAHVMHKRQDDVFRAREFAYLDNLVQKVESLERKIDYMVKNDVTKSDPKH